MIKQFIVFALCCSVGYGVQNAMEKMEITDAQPIQKLSLSLPSFVDTLASDPSVQSVLSTMEAALSGKMREKAAEMKIQASTDDFVEVATLLPTFAPTNLPPTAVPSVVPTKTPSVAPTAAPSVAPTTTPSVAPTAAPSRTPTAFVPSVDPSATPVENPTVAPTVAPSATVNDDDNVVEGYVSYEYWNAAQCGGQKTYQSGVKTDTCFRLGRFFSFKVQISDGE
jgi:hypothetical protein